MIPEPELQLGEGHGNHTCMGTRLEKNPDRYSTEDLGNSWNCFPNHFSFLCHSEPEGRRI